MRILTRWTRADYEQHYASRGWREQSYIDLLADAVSARGDAVAICDDRQRLTWSELGVAVERLAEQLHERGVGSGDVVVSRLPNSVAFAILGLACSWVQAPLAPLVPGTGETQVANVVDRLQAVAYATAGEHAEARPAIANGRELLLLGEGIADGVDIAPAALLASTARSAPAHPSADAVVDLMMTSGTTGAPKAIINTANTKLAGLRPFLEENGFDEQDVWGVVVPMVHNAGWLYGYLASVATGARSVLLDRWRPREFLEAVERERITTTFLAPTHAVDLLEELRRAPADVSSLSCVFVGAAPATPELRRAITEELGVRLLLMYGLTETQASNFTRPADPEDVLTSTVGRPCPGVEVALFEQDRRTPSAAGQTGEVAVRGPSVFGGYYNNQEATSQAFTKDGWFFTGDLGRLFHDGSLSIVGRVKEVIMRGGRGVVPDDVEDAVARCPGVAEVAVIGVSDPRLGEAVCACIVFSAEVCSHDQMKEQLRAMGIGRDLWPDRVLAMDSLPRTPVGKVARSQVRDLVSGAAGFAAARLPTS